MSLISSDAIRRLPIADMRYILAPMRFRTEPMVHQARCLCWALGRRRLAYWLDVGTGKTLLALYTLRIWGCRKALIVCPNSVMQTWADEIDKHLGWDYVLLQGTAAGRRRKLAQQHSLYIVNYGGLRVLWARRTDNKFRPDLNSMKDLDFDALVIDECHSVKSPTALRSILCHELSRLVNYCIIMTGTPLTKDQRDLWSEMNVMDLGRSLGPNYWNFVRTHFKPAGFDWRIKRGSLEKILDKLAPHAIRYKREECFDLPERVYEQRHIPMSAEQLELTNAVLGRALGANPDLAEWTQTDALHVGNKLAQIAGGFMLGEGGGRLDSNPKLRELKRLVEELTGKFVVYHYFVEGGRIIAEAFANMGLPYCEVRGEIKDQANQIDRFRNDPDVRALVAHPACGGEGINLFEANTMIFYSNSYSYVHRVQAEGRIYRLGQERKCLYIDLIADEGNGDSIDFRILRSLRQKGNAAGEVLNYIAGRRA